MDDVPDIGPGFDWFALDRTGQYAIFATAGGGAVPMSVRGAPAAHDQLRAAIAVPGVRDPDFPRSYSRVGLFVYEWSREEGAYRRAATPTGAVPSTLRVELSLSKDVPTLAVDDFRVTDVVGSAAWIARASAALPGHVVSHETCPKCRTRFATRAAIVEPGASLDTRSAVHDESTIVQCPHCRHRFRALESRVFGLFERSQIRGGMMLLLVVLAGIALVRYALLA